MPRPRTPPAAAPARAPLPAQAVLEAVEPALRALITLLLHSGVDYTRLAAELKPWFIEAARAALQQAQQGVTDSAISLRSGVHRKDVRGWRELRLGSQIQREVPLSAQVFARWSADADFRDRRRRPRALARTGPHPSFESLVKAVTQDVHPFTVLQELIRLHLVNVEIHKDVEVVVPNAAGFVPPPGSSEALALLGANLADHTLAAVHNVLGDGAHLEQSVFASGLSAESSRALGLLGRKLWHQMRGEFIAEATRLYAQDRGQPGATQRLRLGSYFWSQATDDGDTPLEHSP